MPSLDEFIEFFKLVGLMMFVSALGAQGWIAFLDIVGVFTKFLEKFRPVASQDKVSRIAVIIGIFVLVAEGIISLRLT